MTEVLEKSTFPASYGEMAGINRAAKADSEDCDTRIAELQERKEGLSNVVNTTYALLTSWGDNDPGKYSTEVSFLDGNGNKVVVQDFLPPGTRHCTDQEEWRAASYEERKKLVPPWKRMVPFENVLRAECPGCKGEHPVLQWYRQTFDSPSFDTWVKRRLIICAAEKTPQQFQLSAEESDGRF